MYFNWYVFGKPIGNDGRATELGKVTTLVNDRAVATQNAKNEFGDDVLYVVRDLSEGKE